MSVFKPIRTRNDVRELCEQDSMNVGVSQSGELFGYDFARNTEVKISKEEASEKLGLSMEIIDEIVKHGGHFQVPEPVVEEPNIEEVPFADPKYFDKETQEQDEEAIVEVEEEFEEKPVHKEEEEDTMKEQLCLMESKIDNLTKLVEQLLEQRLEDARVINGIDNKLL